ncbi:hypothetical protein NP233_g11094 [Leucocoprinus birnbaumii]|uniref:Uncharacterized protein n=1 Tax=Leucocoprinus birnbaumii TaxID=56174 RepID=A0AAD5VH65_9AGAR|nr:hypothetical protein NP233_g11094 [Leucocoprinus birnbaumii]
MAANTKPLIQKVIQSNLEIQKALSTEATELEAQLKELEELIDRVNNAVTSEEVPEAAFEGEFQIPGSKRASGPISSFELLLKESPFYEEASQRAHYLRWTSARPIKGKEAEILADAVKKENMRLEAYRARDNPAAPPIDIANNVQGINWSIVAEKVSDHSNTKRTPEECRIHWVGNLHPKVNHGTWTQEELNRLHDLTANELAAGGKINWARVARDLGTNRIPIDCMKQATTRPRHHWDSLNDQKLREAVQLFGTNNWNLVARHVSPYATTSQCQTRYVRSIDPDIKRGVWSIDEDERLRKAVAVFGNSWVDIAGVLPGRTNDQCREHWGEISTNKVAKGEWTPEEDQQLLELVKELGNKWKAISIRLGGRRTGPHCRVRYDKILRMRHKQTEEATAAVASGVPSQTPPTTDLVGTSQDVDNSASVATLTGSNQPKSVETSISEGNLATTSAQTDSIAET